MIRPRSDLSTRCTAPPCSGLPHLPQGSSLRSVMLSDPSSLNRPHPPRSRAHPNFISSTYMGCLAVRERLGHPRVVPGFRCTFLAGMPSPETPGVRTFDKFQSSNVDIGLRRSVNGSALPISPQSVSRGCPSRGFHGSHLLRPAQLLAPLYGSDQFPSRRGLVLPGFQRDRPVAGYDYSSGWTPLLTGLSPAGMTARLAAPQSGRDTLDSSGSCHRMKAAAFHRVSGSSCCQLTRSQRR